MHAFVGRGGGGRGEGGAGRGRAGGKGGRGKGKGRAPGEVGRWAPRGRRWERVGGGCQREEERERARNREVRRRGGACGVPAIQGTSNFQPTTSLHTGLPTSHFSRRLTWSQFRRGWTVDRLNDDPTRVISQPTVCVYVVQRHPRPRHSAKFSRR